jgi:hypothetical protein
MGIKAFLTKFTDRAKRFAVRLRNDRRANTLMLIGLGAPILFGAAGFAVDYGYATFLKQSLDKAADTAVLTATSQSAAAAGNGYNDLGWLTSYSLDVFQGNIANLKVSVTPTITVVSNGSGGVVATATYSYAMPTYFSQIIGIPTINISGKATATANPVTYINYYILLDISQSMGIGATQADMSALYSRTQTYNNAGCVFGCHVTTGGQPYSNEYLAHNISPKINLRIDAAISAIQTVISDAQAAAGSKQNIKIGLYTMSDNPVSGTRFTTVAAPSTNYTSLSTAAGAITLGNNTSGGIGDSDFSYAMGQFTSLVATSGNGASAATAKSYVFVITDGLRDVYGALCTSGHCTSAFDNTLCNTLKTKATVGTIYTTYLPIYNYNNSAYGYDINYYQLAYPYVNQLPTNLQSCATSATYYYQASDSVTLNTSMKSLFASTLQTARLTQ